MGAELQMAILKICVAAGTIIAAVKGDPLTAMIGLSALLSCTALEKK